MPLEVRESELNHGGQLSDGDIIRVNEMTAEVITLQNGTAWSAAKYGFEHEGQRYILRYHRNWSCYQVKDDDDLGEWGFSTADEVDINDLKRVTTVDIVSERKGFVMEVLGSLLKSPARYDDAMRPYELTGSDYYRFVVGEYMQEGKFPEKGGEVTIPEYEYVPFDELESGDIIKVSGGLNPSCKEVVRYDGDTLICVRPGQEPDRYATKEYTRDSLGACVERRSEENTVWLADDYFLKCVMGMLFDHDYLLMDEAELVEAYERLSNKKMPNLPSDGSKGQWRASMGNKLTFLSWLLGHDKVDDE